MFKWKIEWHRANHRKINTINWWSSFCSTLCSSFLLYPSLSSSLQCMLLVSKTEQITTFAAWLFRCVCFCIYMCQFAEALPETAAIKCMLCVGAFCWEITHTHMYTRKHTWNIREMHFVRVCNSYIRIRNCSCTHCYNHVVNTRHGVLLHFTVCTHREKLYGLSSCMWACCLCVCLFVFFRLFVLNYYEWGNSNQV